MRCFRGHRSRRDRLGRSSVGALRCARRASPLVLAARHRRRHGRRRDLFEPCRGDCAVDDLRRQLRRELARARCWSPRPSRRSSWNYATDDHLVATAISRTRRSSGTHCTLEPEVGIAQRFGQQDATEVWGALLLPLPRLSLGRRRADHRRGLHRAELGERRHRRRAGPGERRRRAASSCTSSRRRSPSPLPSHPNVELVFRMHHRSGVFGLVSDAWGGAQYATVGLRVRF